jgi:hypothetical protein
LTKASTDRRLNDRAASVLALINGAQTKFHTDFMRALAWKNIVSPWAYVPRSAKHPGLTLPASLANACAGEDDIMVVVCAAAIAVFLIASPDVSRGAEVLGGQAH